MSDSVQPLVCRGIRGATTVDQNDPEQILQATRELLALMIRQNGIEKEDVASVIFTVTRDLDAEFPALAARQLGWMSTSLMCSYEITVPGSLESCVRVLIHWNTSKNMDDIVHVYLRKAAVLRPDITSLPPVDWEELENWINAHLDDRAPAARKPIDR
jgi:chorismate mutase